MDDHEADEHYDRLVANVTAVQQALTSANEQHWAGWLDSARRQPLAHDGHGLVHLLAAYGGMGSFNDIPLDDDTARMRSQIFADAEALLNDLRD